MSIYYQDDLVTLHHGQMEDILPTLTTPIDLVVADPPYGETSLNWDRWPTGWPTLIAAHTASMWCFGSMRMFLDRRDEFATWKLSQDIVWEKHNGTGFTTDRFKRVHEHATHWYQGTWADIHHNTPRIPGGTGNKHVPTRGQTPHTGKIGTTGYTDDGLRLTRSVIHAPNAHSNAINPTQKPTGILEPLISYGCPPSGLVLDPFAGSCSTLVSARNLSRHAIGIEAREEQCETAAIRLSQQTLDLGTTA